MVNLVLHGTCVVAQDERLAVLRPGDFALFDTSRPGTLRHETNTDLFVLWIPQTLMQAVMPRASTATATAVDGRVGTAALLRPVLGRLLDMADSAPLASHRHLATAAVELVAASLAEITSLSTGLTTISPTHVWRTCPSPRSPLGSASSAHRISPARSRPNSVPARARTATALDAYSRTLPDSVADHDIPPEQLGDGRPGRPGAAIDPGDRVPAVQGRAVEEAGEFPASSVRISGVLRGRLRSPRSPGRGPPPGSDRTR